MFERGLDAIATSTTLSDTSLEISLKVDARKLPNSGVYVFDHIVKLKENVDVLPQWISEWDMDITKLQEWKKGVSQFEGNTTLNLKKFTFDVFQALILTQKPILSHVYFYIRKE